MRVLHNISNSAPRRMKPQRGDYESICKVGAVGKDGRPHGAYRDYFQVDLQEAVRKRVAGTSHMVMPTLIYFKYFQFIVN